MDTFEDNQDPGLPEAIRKQLKRERIHHDHKKAVDALNTQFSEEIEEKILVGLWQELGDHTRNYWEAMSGISAVVELQAAVADKLRPLPVYLRARMMKALSDIFAHQSGLLKEIDKAQDDLERKLSLVP